MSRPHQERGEGDGCLVGLDGLVVAGGDASPLLQAVEAAFDHVALLVELLVEDWRSSAAAAGGLVVCGGTDVGRTVGRLVDGGVDVGEREVLDAVGSGVFDGVEGVEVGVGDSGVPAVSDGSVTDGDALAVAAESGDFPSESSSSHVPVPPRTRTAAPPAIHGARRDGRRCRFMVSLSHCPGDPAVVAVRTLRAGRG